MKKKSGKRLLNGNQEFKKLLLLLILNNKIIIILCISIDRIVYFKDLQLLKLKITEAVFQY